MSLSTTQKMQNALPSGYHSSAYHPSSSGVLSNIQNYQSSKNYQKEVKLL